MRNQSCALPFISSICQGPRCRVMCRSSRCQCICGVITSLVQSGGYLPVDVGPRRMPFDPHEFQPPRVIDFQHVLKLVPQIRVLLIALLGLAAHTTVAIRTTYSLSDLISRFPSWIFIAAMRANDSARLLVCSRPGKVKEQFLLSLMLKNTPQPALLNLESWIQTHAPSVQATTQSWFWVSLSNLASDKTLSGKVSQRIDCAHALGPLSAQATDSGSSRNMPHLEAHSGYVKRSRLLGACFLRRSVSHRGHLQSICSSSSGSSPQKKTQRESAL